jgi:hypothetical protein
MIKNAEVVEIRSLDYVGNHTLLLDKIGSIHLVGTIDWGTVVHTYRSGHVTEHARILEFTSHGVSLLQGIESCDTAGGS